MDEMTRSVSFAKKYCVNVNSSKVFTVKSENPTSVELNTAAAGYTGDQILLILSDDSLYDLEKYRLYSLYVELDATEQFSPSLDVIALSSEFKENSTNSLNGVKRFAYYYDGKVSFNLDKIIKLDDIRYGIVLGGYGVTVNVQSVRATLTYLSPYTTRNKSPADGYTTQSSKPIQFSWSVEEDYENFPLPEFASDVVSSMELRWRVKGQQQENTIKTGTSSYLSPAYTFPENTEIEWRLYGEMDNGVPIKSGVDDVYPHVNTWYTLILNDIDAIPVTSIVSPINTVLSADSDIAFIWEHYTSTGTPQTRADIQTGSTVESLSDFATVQGAANTYTVPANTFQAGDLYWRVRTYNADGVAGEWSETAHVIVIGASPAPLLTLERISSRPIIRWEAQGQIAYELEIVGAESATQYGQINRYEAKSILAPGNYTVRVRVQNKYSLWSAWAEAALPVTNAPGAEITLAATPDSMGNVSLSWSAAGLFERYEVLRDGNVIARTATTSFTDRFAIGSVQYQVRGIVDEAGNYSLSNAVEQSVSVRYVQIAPVSGGEWLALPYSTTDVREVSTNVSRAVTYQQYTGAKLPTATVSEALTVSHQIAAAFPWSQKAAADRLEAMIGQLVCVKDPRGERFVGVLGSYSKTSSRFYVAYSLTITPVDWEEVAT